MSAAGKIPQATLRLEDTPAPDDVEAFHAILRDFNTRHAGPSGYEPLTILLRSSDGTIVGGLDGGTSRGWLSVVHLAVDENFRGRGYGSQLLALAEQTAIARGCRLAHLDTASFQARPFYERQGYTVFGTLGEESDSFQVFFMQKKLTPTAGISGQRRLTAEQKA